MLFPDSSGGFITVENFQNCASPPWVVDFASLVMMILSEHDVIDLPMRGHQSALQKARPDLPEGLVQIAGVCVI
ncbi:hypothetical protein AD953_02875 [Acetobacter malorum]|uniref:Uncharacterized protein n=1 Tax=Acetobacter malorum TaxID=178901 RepID=A0A149VGF5_9PROT|nr:hypothetical protein AD953_02875 [Acetobacter malorum]